MYTVHLSEEEISAIKLSLRSSRKQGYVEYVDDSHLIALQAEDKLSNVENSLIDLFRETGAAQKAFWKGFETAKMSDNSNIREHWENYKTSLKAQN